MLSKDTSPRLGPAWAIITGSVLLIIACLLFCQAGLGLKRGKVMAFSKKRPDIVSRRDSAHRYWQSEIQYLGMGLMFTGFGIWIMRDGILKKL